MNIYKSKFLEISFSENKNLLYFTWLDTTVEMNEEDYKSEMLNYLEELKKYAPSILLVDDRQMQFVISVELQEWIGANIFSVGIEVGLKAFAVVMNEDIITQLSTQLSAEENPEPEILKSAFFDNLEDAEQWLLNQK